MSEFLFSYGLFLAKVVTALVALVFVMAIIAANRGRDTKGALSVTKVNDKFTVLKDTIEASVTDKKGQKALKKERSKQAKADQKAKKDNKPRLFVLDFDGDIRATGVEALRNEVSALVQTARPNDEVLMTLENAGGVVHDHGLAASQLVRLKAANIPLTIAVDKVAASGGYMMAAVAEKIVAAPFAVIGSIGVLAQLPNFNRLLDKAGVDFEQHTAGEYKRTVTMFGKNTDKEREKLQQDLAETHTLFRDFVAQYRTKLDLEKVATGEHWYGSQAQELGLIDDIKTSDEFLIEALDVYDIFEVKFEIKKGIQEKMFGGLFSLARAAADKLGSRENQQRYR